MVLLHHFPPLISTVPNQPCLVHTKHPLSPPSKDLVGGEVCDNQQGSSMLFGVYFWFCFVFPSEKQLSFSGLV